MEHDSQGTLISGVTPDKEQSTFEADLLQEFVMENVEV
jgi:hypothetical protein